MGGWGKGGLLKGMFGGENRKLTKKKEENNAMGQVKKKSYPWGKKKRMTPMTSRKGDRTSGNQDSKSEPANDVERHGGGGGGKKVSYYQTVSGWEYRGGCVQRRRLFEGKRKSVGQKKVELTVLIDRAL